jgi:hypothetical protein
MGKLMKSIRDYLGRVNTWAAIAVLALAGWLIDSLLWYLETHPLTPAGFKTYLAHSWYALPILIAIFVMIRLRRPSELLSLTIYNERGALIYRQGDVPLKALVQEVIFASFRGTTQENGLHRLDLPSGPVVYFFRQGALTLVACFSKPPRPAQLEAELHLLRQQESPPEDLLRDLPPDVAALAINLLHTPVERDLFNYLWANRRMAMTVEDWAGQVGHAVGDVASAFKNLAQLGLVQRQDVRDITFFRLTGDEIWLRRLEQFNTWRVDWLMHARRVEQLVGPASLIMPIKGRITNQ